MVDRPNEDASNEEIARWMEEDFGEALADGMEQATEEDEDDSYGFVQNVPTETHDGTTYVTVKFPRDDLVDALRTGTVTPQVQGAVSGSLFRGQGTVTIMERGSGKGKDSSNESNGNGNGA